MSPGKTMLRGIIHCHSWFSEDSRIPISRYLRFARQHALDFVILTDHDTTAGSRALQEAARNAMPELQVPLAAEYKTDEGDVIAAFLNDEIHERVYDRFVEAARAQGALLLLPHPYVSHKHPERLAPDCDLIEIFNSRANPEKNRLAAELARALGKPGFAASDAHLARGLRNAILELPAAGGLQKSLMAGDIRCAQQRPTPRWETLASQYIKAAKLRDIGMASRLTAEICRAATRKLSRGMRTL